MKTEFVATFQKIQSNPREVLKLDFELIYSEKPENQIWNDAIAVAWKRLKDKETSEQWELREVFAPFGDNNCLTQWAVKVNSNPRSTSDTWRDLTYSERFNCEPIQYLKGGAE